MARTSPKKLWIEESWLVGPRMLEGQEPLQSPRLTEEELPDSIGQSIEAEVGDPEDHLRHKAAHHLRQPRGKFPRKIYDLLSQFMGGFGIIHMGSPPSYESMRAAKLGMV